MENLEKTLKDSRFCPYCGSDDTGCIDDRKADEREYHCDECGDFYYVTLSSNNEVIDVYAHNRKLCLTN